MIVTLLRTPLNLYQRAEDYNADLMREFALIAVGASQHDQADVPIRLLELIAALAERYAHAVEAPDVQRDIAVASGAPCVDLVYDVPPEVGSDAALLEMMLNEAQEHCRNGELITLAAPDDVLAFQHWYTSEFVRQVNGEPARPWTGSLD